MPAFEVLEGFPKGCGGDVLAMEWCPTMDLIALITSDSQILVHRVTWQRLFVISVDEQPVRCLAWRPDGKQLAAGHVDGSVTLYDVEDGELLSCHREHPSPLCLFSWVEAVPAGEAAARESPYVGSLANLFAPLPQLPKQATAQQLLMDEGAPQLDAPLRHLLFEAHATLGFDVAVTADTHARVHLAVHGRFSLGTLHLAELPALHFGGGAPPTLVAVQLASTLHALSVVLRTPAATEVMLPDGTRQAHAAGTTLLLAFRTGQLGRSRQEISALALVHMQCEALVQRAYAALGTAERVWREAAEGLHAKLAKMGEVLREDGRASTPAVELAMLLASGVPPSCVQAFLLREFSAEALTRTHKAITVAAAALTQLCVCHLAPACDILMQRLGHLHGLARWPFHFAAVGLQPQRVHAALEATVSLRAAVEALLVGVQTAQAELGMLLSWLVRTNRRLRDEPPPTADELPPPNSTALCALLKRAAQTADGLPRDPVLELFSEDDGPPLAMGAPDALDGLAQLPSPLRLPAAQRQLDAALEECFRSVAQHVSAGLQLHSCTALATGAGADAPLLEMQHQPPPTMPAAPTPPTGEGEAQAPASPLLMLSLVLRDGAEAAGSGGGDGGGGGGGGGGAQLVLLRARCGLQDADAPAWEACAVRCAPRQPLLSCHFYKDEQLALVLAGEAAGSSQLTIMPCSQLAYVPLGAGLGGGSTPLLARVAEMLASGRLAVQPMGEEARHRCLAAMEAAQLALSQQRGMACLVAHMRRVMLLDLEEDEEGDEDEDGDDGGDGDDVEEEDEDEDMTMDDD